MGEAGGTASGWQHGPPVALGEAPNKVISLDTETVKVAEDGATPDLVSVQLDDGNGPLLLHADDPVTPSIVHDVLRGLTVCMDPFDALALRKRYPELQTAIFDAYRRGAVTSELTREILLDLADGAYRRRGGYSLAEVAKRRAGLNLDKSADTCRLRYGELLSVPVDQWPEEARRYALDDAAAKAATYAAQEQVRCVDGFDVLEDEHRQARKWFALELMNEHGFAVDVERVDDLDAQLADEHETLREQLERDGLVRVGGTKKAPRWVKCENAARELVEEWATEHDLKVKRGKKGASVAEKELARLGVPADHPLGRYQRYGSIQGLRSRVLSKIRRPVVRAHWEPLMETGRTSCSAPPLQQLPRKGGFRECFVARPGHKLVIRDWSAAELVSWSQVCVELFGVSSMGEAIAKGQDPHLVFVARDLLERPYEVVAGRYKDGDPEIVPLRQLAKAANFGFLGALGAEGFVPYARDGYGVNLTLSQSHDCRDRWLRGWHEAPRYYAFVKSAMGPDGFAHLVQVRSNRVRGGCFFTQGCNTLFQGLTADMAGDCLWEIADQSHTQPSSPLYGARQVYFGHDENVLEVEESRAEAVDEALDRLMVEVGSRWCPDVPSRTEGKIVTRYTK